MIVCGLDPGTHQSAVVTYHGAGVASHFIEPNERILEWARGDSPRTVEFVLVIEEFESYGMAVGKEVFRTIRWAGNFEEAWKPARVEFMPRRIVKTHICHTSRATDANIRQALLDRFGGVTAIGTKKAPGPLYGIKSHEWAALALAITFYDLNGHIDLSKQVRPGVTAEF